MALAPIGLQHYLVLSAILFGARISLLVGLAAVALLPRMLEGMHLGDRTHPRGA